MSFWRGVACGVLLLVVGVSLAANWLAPAGYAKQYREVAGAPPSHEHWLGTDEIGRDRFARVLYGTRISLLLAPAAALLSTLMAALVGGLAGYLGGSWARAAMAVTDLFLSLPWLFLLITVRALMPLNVSPAVSVTVTFLLLGLLGWTGAARVLCASAGTVRKSDFVRQARASGIRGARLFWVHEADGRPDRQRDQRRLCLELGIHGSGRRRCRDRQRHQRQQPRLLKRI